MNNILYIFTASICNDFVMAMSIAGTFIFINLKLYYEEIHN